MTRIREIYHCEICGNVVEVVHEGESALVCCGQPMNKLDPKTEDQGSEKHVPVVEATGSGIRVKVGSIEHPMEEKHYIKMIEVLKEDRVCRAELKPGMKPEAEFRVPADEVKAVREYCNVHGLWKA